LVISDVGISSCSDRYKFLTYTTDENIFGIGLASHPNTKRNVPNPILDKDV